MTEQSTRMTHSKSSLVCLTVRKVVACVVRRYVAVSRLNAFLTINLLWIRLLIITVLLSIFVVSVINIIVVELVFTFKNVANEALKKYITINKPQLLKNFCLKQKFPVTLSCLFCRTRKTNGRGKEGFSIRLYHHIAS